MTEGAVAVVGDVLLVGTVFTHTTHPELIISDTPASHNTRWQLFLHTDRERDRQTDVTRP